MYFKLPFKVSDHIDNQIFLFQLQVLESNIQCEYAAMEQRLSIKFDEQCHQVKAAIETVVQQTAQHVSGNLSQLVCVRFFHCCVF